VGGRRGIGWGREGEGGGSEGLEKSRGRGGGGRKNRVGKGWRQERGRDETGRWGQQMVGGKGGPGKGMDNGTGE